MQWKDVTSYSRDDQERIPGSWEVRAGGLRIAVARHIHYPPDVWLLRTNWTTVDMIELHSRDLAGAQAMALDIVRTRLSEALTALDE